MSKLPSIAEVLHKLEPHFSTQNAFNLKFENECLFAKQQLQKNSYTLQAAQNNPDALKGAILNVAAIGISLNPATAHAYLVPRSPGKGQAPAVCLDISYRGLVKLATDSGSIQWAKAVLVYEGDKFEWRGPAEAPLHTADVFNADRMDAQDPLKNLKGGYCLAKLSTGEYMVDVMTAGEILEVRNASQAKSGPWKGPWAAEMAKKGVALDTPIPTPDGWSLMRDITAGDYVFDMNGSVVKVTAVSEIKHLPCFKVTFSNGDSVVCDDEHRWLARGGGGSAHRLPFTVMTINEIFEAKNSAGMSVTIPMQGALDTPDADLLIDPYLLGYWLGDGDSLHGNITCGAEDVEHVRSVFEASKYKVSGVIKDPRSNAHRVKIVGGFVADLRELGLLQNKHVPAQYLRGSISQRKALLAGLMDSDGHLDKARGRAHFYNKREDVSRAVYELAASLGEAPTITVKKVRGYGVESKSHFVQWKPSFCCMRSERKAANYQPRKIAQYRSVAKVERVETVPTKCISVEGESKTYLCGRSMAVTHNTLVKRASKSWPQSDGRHRLDEAIGMLNEHEGIQTSEVDEKMISDFMDLVAEGDGMKLLSFMRGLSDEQQATCFNAAPKGEKTKLKERVRQLQADAQVVIDDYCTQLTEYAEAQDPFAIELWDEMSDDVRPLVEARLTDITHRQIESLRREVA